MFAGYMITEQYVNTIEIWRLSIDHMLLRCGIGTRLVSSLKGRLLDLRSGKKKIRTIVADVDEENLRAQQFFRSVGFRARLPIVRDGEGDYYRFAYEPFGRIHAGT
jgi:ribosomal protein S18 acetylase RimI-like enzyme